LCAQQISACLDAFVGALATDRVGRLGAVG
jgi:hypothetical protein